MRTDEKSRRITEAAIKVFVDVGFAKATMSDISRIAGISDSAVYRAYSSKDEILFEIYEGFWGRILNEIQAVEKSTWETSSIAKLKKIIVIIQNIITQTPELVRVIASTSLRPAEKIKDEKLKKARIEIRSKNRKVLSLIDQIIIKGKAENEIIEEIQPAVMRQILIGSFQTLAYGIFYQFKNEPEIGYSISEAMEGFNILLNFFSQREE